MPIFVYVFGLPMKTAVPMSLGVVGVTSLVGAFGHWRRGNMRLASALAFAPAAMLGTLAGARLATLLSNRAQLVLFGVVMAAAAIAMLRGRPAERTVAPAGPLRAALRTAPAGVGVGILTGLVGVGGGFLIVPALALLLGLPMHAAVGTSLLVIAFNSVAGVIGYLDQGTLQWATMGGFTALAIVGVMIGGRLASRVEAGRLRRGFAIFLVVMAIFILVRTLASGAG